MSRSSVLGKFYQASAVREGVELRLITSPLPELELHDGSLIGETTRVTCGGVLVEDDPDGLVGRPLEPLALRSGSLCFEPSAGGVRTRENRLAKGAFNDQVAEATKFGMVNAFVHASVAAASINEMLAELGSPPLPVLPVVVSAHPGSRLPGFVSGDGDYRSGRMRPFSGGHYRLSQLTSGVPEPEVVCATGEVHLGPGRLRHAFAGIENYLRAASHNPATIYHEVAHHACRHTADFRLNAERMAAEQRNGKPAAEEGACDYLAAALLGSGRPYGWYRPERGERRDPEAWSGAESPDSTDAHAVGAAWAGMWWECRRRLLEAGLLASGRDHDRVLLATLLALGEVGSLGGPGGRRRRQARRGAFDTIANTYLASLRHDAGAAGARLAADVFNRVPLPASSTDGEQAC